MSDKVYVVFSYGEPMPITSCRTPELAQEYASALARLPEDHPLHTDAAVVDELPLLDELPEPLRDPEHQTWQEDPQYDDPEGHGTPRHRWIV